LVFDLKQINESSEGFINKYLLNINPSKLIFGSDYKFGSNFAKGKILSKKFDCQIVNVNKKYKTKKISELISLGKFDKANKLLSNDHYFFGKIEHGSQTATILGYPTANIYISEQIVEPLNGSYISEIEINSKMYQGVSFVKHLSNS